MAIEGSNRQGKSEPAWLVVHQQLDILLIASNGRPIGKRPYLTTLIGENGDNLGMWVSLEQPDNSSIEHWLREVEMVNDNRDPSHGRPVTLHVDNGQPLCGKPLALSDRQIVRTALCKPRFKGKIERDFRIVNCGLTRGMPGHRMPAITLQQLQKILTACIRDYHARLGSDTSDYQE
jgi:hypothetical protein